MNDHKTIQVPAVEGETMRTTYHCEGCGEDVTADTNHGGAHYWQRSDGDWDACGPVVRTDKSLPAEAQHPTGDTEPITSIDCGRTPGFDRLVVDCPNFPPGREVRAQMQDGTWEMRSVGVVEPGSGIGVVEVHGGEFLYSVCVDEDARDADYCMVEIRLEEDDGD